MPAWIIQISPTEFVSSKYEETIIEQEEKTKDRMQAYTFKKHEEAQRFKKHYNIQGEIIFQNIPHKQKIFSPQKKSLINVSMI